MMPDYQGNAKKNKPEPKPEKVIEKVVVGEVIVKKKSLGRKFKDLFIEADLRTVVRYVCSEVLLPAARNMIVDGASKGVERMMYGESAVRRSRYGPNSGPRITYNNPINRGYRDASYRDTTSRPTPPSGGPGSARQNQDTIILSSREEAELVLERLNDIIDTYEVVSVADLNDLVGLPTTYINNNWGWIFLGDVQIQQIREGYLLNMPPAEPIK